MQSRNKLSVKERFEDSFTFEHLTIEQSLQTEPPTCVYDAAIILAKFISELPDDFSSSNLLELGAGTGLTGLYLANRFKRTMLTDCSSVLPLLESNRDRNSSTALTDQLWWGNRSEISMVMSQLDG